MMIMGTATMDMATTRTARCHLLTSLLAGWGFLVASHGAWAAEPPSNEARPEAQTMCPVTTTEPVDPAISTPHRGRQVFFCCTKCRKKFLAEPEKYAGNLPPVVAHAEHAHGPTDRTGGSEALHGRDHFVRFYGKLHPLLLHFPIALLMAAAFAEALAWLWGSPFMVGAARFCLVLGAAGALFAATSGWAAAAFSHHPLESAAFLERHRWLGTSTAILSWVAFALSEIARRRGSPGLVLTYRLALGATAALVGWTGYVGGILVYGLEHYAW